MKLQEFEQTVLECLGTTREKLFVKNRSNREVIAMRCIVFYFLKKHTNLTWAAIGDRYNREHCTVMYALRNWDYYRTSDEALKRKIAVLEEKFKELPKIIVCKECGREI